MRIKQSKTLEWKTSIKNRSDGVQRGDQHQNQGNRSKNGKDYMDERFVRLKSDDFDNS